MNIPYADYVNPYIGTISHLLKSTRPEAFLPHCYPKSAPVFNSNTDFFCNEILRGFPLGLTQFLPGRLGGEFHQTVDHSRVSAHPYGYSMELEENGPVVEAAVTEHAYIYRLTNAGRLCLLLTEGGTVQRQGDCLLLHARGDRASRQFEHEYLQLRLDCPFDLSEGPEGSLLLSPQSMTSSPALRIPQYMPTGSISLCLIVFTSPSRIIFIARYSTSAHPSYARLSKV